MRCSGRGSRAWISGTALFDAGGIAFETGATEFVAAWLATSSLRLKSTGAPSFTASLLASRVIRRLIFLSSPALLPTPVATWRWYRLTKSIIVCVVRCLQRAIKNSLKRRRCFYYRLAPPWQLEDRMDTHPSIPDVTNTSPILTSALVVTRIF